MSLSVQTAATADRVIYYQYRHERARRTLRGIAGSSHDSGGTAQKHRLTC
jgi:hypothetical protein